MARDGKRGRPVKWPRIRARKMAGKTYHMVDAGAFGLTAEQQARGVKRNRKTFSTLAEAKAHAGVLRAQRAAEAKAAKFTAENRAVSLAQLTDDQRADVLASFKLLDGGRKGTLAAAVAFWLQHAAPANPRTVSETVAELIAAMDRKNLRPRTLSDMEIHLRGFTASHGERGIYAVTVQDLETWIAARSGKLAPQTRKHYRRCLHRLFAFAVKRKYRPDNPAAALEVPVVETSAPEVFTIAQARALLLAAANHDAEQAAKRAALAAKRATKGLPPPPAAGAMVPYYAVGLFAGLRTENELAGLDWRMIDLAGRTIEVSAASAKKRRARTVEIADNLAEWLAPHRQDAGPIFYSRRAHRTIVEAAKVAWPANGMRHSFASYHLAAHNDAGKTALLLGHPHGVDVLFNHYRRMVKATEAKGFWQIRPASATNVIQLNAAR
jgi:site-specific recombinase XerD